MENSTYFRPHLTVLVTGCNQVKLLNALKKQGIRIKNVSKSDFSHMHITIEKKDRVKTFAILERMCYTYSVEVYHGIGKVVKTATRRIGVLVGAMLVAAIAIVSSMVVTSVEINGASATVRSLVAARLKENGTNVGKPLYSINRDEIRKSVNAVDGVAECSVKIDGTRLILTVIGRTVESENQPQWTAVVARQNAIVSRVVCRSGTAGVKAGDVVREGQTLIEGALYDAEGKLVKSVVADGEVYGTAFEYKRYLLSSSKIEYERTGKSKTVTTLGLFGLKIGKDKSPFARSESVTEVSVINALLPIKVTRTVFYETEMRKTELTKEELIRLAEEKAKEETFGGETATVKSNARQLSNGTYEISVYVEKEGLISKGQ